MVRAVAGALTVALLALGLPLPAAAAGDTSCPPVVEEEPGRQSVRLRPGRVALTACPISEAAYRSAVRDWLAAHPPQAPLPASFALGRAVDYPWLSRLIAEQALALPDWRQRVARSRRGQLHELAAPVLQGEALRARLALPFADSRLRVSGVSYEKVLYGPADEHAPAPGRGKLMVPFDAQLWLRLEPRAASAR